MDIFRDYFTREALLASIAKVQYVPGKFAPWFESRSLNTTTFALEDVPIEGYNLLTETPRGTPGKVETLTRRQVHTFQTKHYRVDGSVYADEVLNMRGTGVNNAVDIIQRRRDETMAKLRRDIDMTHESLRLNCILSPDNAFGPKPADVTVALTVDATKTRDEIFTKIIKPMESALDGIPFTGLYAFCDDTFWGRLIENKAIKDTLIYHSMAMSLRNDPRETVMFGGVTWERYRGYNTIAMPTGKAIVLPQGVSEMFLQAFAPADTLDTVGTGSMGTPYFPQAIPSVDNRRWYMEIQTNCVMVCTRPYAVLTVASS
jgi:hypothetical protein